MKTIRNLLIAAGAAFFICWAIGSFVPGMNFYACLGPSEKCHAPTEEQE